MKYNKITKEQLFQFMIENRLTADFYEMIFTSKFIASRLKTSVYQVRKYLKELVNDGLIKYECKIMYDYGEYRQIEYTSAPYWGYTVK